MQCPSCQSEIDDDADACFQCGRAVFALTQGRVLSGRYEIVRPLGRGGMGRVYEAFDRVMEEHVALKVLRSEFLRNPEMSRRFVSEIKLARKIGHRNVCRIHEYGEDGDIRFIVMELLSGVTLKEYLRDEPLSPDAAYDVSIQVARGLNAVHELGIVHRDVKTANIMIDEGGAAKLVDFGIAKQVSDLTDPTLVGMIMTPEYMSPEQVQGGQASFHSDIYALGCVVYEVFTGHAPFRGPTPVATLLMHLHDDLPLDSEDAKRIPPHLVPILKRALAKDPDERYESVPDFAKDLSAACAAGGFTGAVHRGGLGLAATHHPRGRRLWTWALGIVAIVAAAVGAVVYLALFGPAPSALPPPASMTTGEPSSSLMPAETTPEAVPSPLASIAPETTMPRPESPLAASSRPPATVAPPPAPVTGILRLLVVPEARVSIDGSPMGVVARRELTLAPGTHIVRVEHPDYQPLQRRVTIREGETEFLVLDLAEKGIRRNP